MPSTIRGNDNFDSAYGAALKAWVNFNGTGTVAIRASLNVSSITDNGVGDYTVNFTTALPDANFAMCGSAGGVDTSASNPGTVTAKLTSGRSTTSVRFYVINASSAGADREYVEISIFR